MKIGVCADWRNASQLEAIRASGADYVELNFTSFSGATAEEVAALGEKLKANGTPCLAYNCMLPGDLHVAGKTRDFARADAYLAHQIRLLSVLDGRIVVFGSGRSRSCGEGDTLESVRKDLAVFLRDHVAPAFALGGYTCAMEPLSECDVIHTVDDGMQLMQAADRREIGLLIDFYHTGVNGEDMTDLTAYGRALRHTHIANPAGRSVPARGDGVDYTSIFRALKAAGYDGGISIEGSIPKDADYAALIREGVACLRAAMADAGV